MALFTNWLCGPLGAGALLLTGIILSLRLRFVQIRQLPRALRNMFLSDKDASGQGTISPMQAICTALGGTMGTGNIAGVAGAMALGGPGAVLWMWIAGFFGMATKYLEIALAVRYRRRNARGEWVGGPMYYMEACGKGGRYAARIFCICALLASLGVGNAAQVNVLSGSICTLAQSFGWGMDEFTLRIVSGAVLSALIAFMALGGMRRIARAAERQLPFVSVVYVFCMLAVIVTNAQRILPAFRLIVTSAFSPRAALGGAAGITLRAAVSSGVTRGVFTNEAGMGSSAMAHAAAHGAAPHTQGLWGLVEVFIDTFVVCSLTALGILCSGCAVPYGSVAGAELITQAMATVFNARTSALLITLSLLCFALSTLMTWSFYGMRCMEYLLHGKGIKIYLTVFSLLALPFSVMETADMWEMTEVFTVLMALCNLPFLLRMSGRKMKKEG